MNNYAHTNWASPLHLFFSIIPLTIKEEIISAGKWSKTIHICFLVSRVKPSRQEQVRITDLTELRHALGTQLLSSLNVIRWVIRSDVHRKWLLDPRRVETYNPFAHWAFKNKGSLSKYNPECRSQNIKTKKHEIMRSLKIVIRGHGLATLWTDVRNLWLLISSRLPVCLFKAKTGVP